MQPTQPMPPIVPPPAPVTQPPIATAAPVVDNTPTGDIQAPELADDGDLIEKEWVAQAKQIIQSTANDPYEQNAQFTQLRATYLQKRYGKQLKTGN